MTKTDKIILALGAVAIASAAIVGGISLTKTSSNQQAQAKFQLMIIKLQLQQVAQVSQI